LSGRPREPERRRPRGIRFRATVLEWPNGVIGDIGLFLAWG